MILQESAASFRIQALKAQLLEMDAPAMRRQPQEQKAIEANSVYSANAEMQAEAIAEKKRQAEAIEMKALEDAVAEKKRQAEAIAMKVLEDAVAEKERQAEAIEIKALEDAVAEKKRQAEAIEVKALEDAVAEKKRQSGVIRARSRGVEMQDDGTDANIDAAFAILYGDDAEAERLTTEGRSANAVRKRGGRKGTPCTHTCICIL
jgi:hypothetical protein